MGFIKWWCIIYNFIMALLVLSYMIKEDINMALLYVWAGSVWSMMYILNM